VIAGYHQDGLRQVNMQLWNWRGIDVINAHERDPQRYVDGMKRAVKLMTEGVMDPTPLYTHRLPLDRLGEALELTRTRPDGFMKALVTT
jgi:threonine dehydrogenase-like Zn-dependent dehydrogenase